MIPEEQNKALDAWETSARHWDKHRALIAQMFARLTAGLVKEARIGMDQKVLDIGGGSGEPSFHDLRHCRTNGISNVHGSCSWYGRGCSGGSRQARPDKHSLQTMFCRCPAVCR